MTRALTWLLTAALLVCRERSAHAQGAVVDRARTLVDARGWVCAIDAQRDVYCWLRALSQHWPAPSIASSSQAFEKVPGLSNVEKIAGSEAYLCALDRAGSVQCWGSVWSFESQRLWPKPIALAGPARDLDVSTRNACAVLQNGQVQCWGFGLNADDRPNPEGMRTVSEKPLTVQLPAAARQVATFGGGFCALDERKQAHCWDALDATTHPLQLDAILTLDGACAIAGDQREVFCWEKEYPEDAVIDGRSWHLVLRKVPGIKRVRQLADVGEARLALTENGTVYHWGTYYAAGVRDLGGRFDVRTYPVRDNYYAAPEPDRALLPETRIHRNAAPKRIASRLKVRAIIASASYTCLELEGGEPYCEWLLGQKPFHLAEVWPTARFDSGTGR